MFPYLEEKIKQAQSQNDYMKVWEDLGMLDGVKEKDVRKAVAKAMSAAAFDFLNSESEPNAAWECIAFPIIRRILTDEVIQGRYFVTWEMISDILHTFTIQEVIDYFTIGSDNTSRNSTLNEIQEYINQTQSWNVSIWNFGLPEGIADIARRNHIDIEAEWVALVCDFVAYKITHKYQPIA